MTFVIRLGVPEMKELWEGLCHRRAKAQLDRVETKLYKQLGKAMSLLANNPKHPGLASHEIDDLSRKYGFKIFQSYLENKTPSAGRLFWAYGPNKGEITVLAVEPHPEDEKRGSYARIKLSSPPS